MQQSDQTMYVARSEAPMLVEELQFHLQQFTTAQEKVRELVARGYCVIGYMHGCMMYDLDDRPLPNEGTREMDLVLSGPMASELFPKNRWKFGDLAPKPTSRELEERLSELRKSAMLITSYGGYPKITASLNQKCLVGTRAESERST